MSVHPTAIVHPEARLEPGVEVGPFAIVDGDVAIGSGTRVMARAWITGATTIGRDCEIHMGAILGHAPQDLSFPRDRVSGLVVGDRNVFREYVTVHRATRDDAPTTIGDDNYFMANAHVAHDVRIGSRNILCNGALVGGHAEIADRVFLSGHAAVHQFCRVGPVAMISGNSGTSLDVPPYTIVTGRSRVRALNVVGMRRAGLDGAARSAVKDLYRAIRRAYGDGEAMQAALAAAPDVEAVAVIRAFWSRPSKKGVAWPLLGEAAGA